MRNTYNKKWEGSHEFIVSRENAQDRVYLCLTKTKPYKLYAVNVNAVEREK